MIIADAGVLSSWRSKREISNTAADAMAEAGVNKFDLNSAGME